jgi:tetratricopeptide (TPR) repeat protein
MTHQDYFNKAVKAYDKQDFTLAADFFSKAISLNVSMAEYYYQRGMCFLHLKINDKSLLDFNQAAELEPDNPFRFSSRAYVKDRMGKIHEAIADYEMALRLDPQDAVSYNNLGLLEEKLGYKKKAALNYKMADDISKQVDAFFGNEEKKESIVAEEITDNKVVEKETKQSVFSIILNVFTNKESFREFVTFVKNGCSAK